MCHKSTGSVHWALYSAQGCFFFFFLYVEVQKGLKMIIFNATYFLWYNFNYLVLWKNYFWWTRCKIRLVLSLLLIAWHLNSRSASNVIYVLYWGITIISINLIAIWNLYVLVYSEPDYFKQMEYSLATSLVSKNSKVILTILILNGSET